MRVMGLREFFFGPPVAAFQPTSLASPWSDNGSLARIVASDVLGVTNPGQRVTTRAGAMAIPAVQRGRNLLVGVIAGLPLRALDQAGPLATQPRWLTRTDSVLSPQHRMAWTVDDLLFSGWSLWAVQRGYGDEILSAARVPIDRWRFDNDGQVLIDDRPVDDSSVVLIPGLSEGILAHGGETLAIAKRLETSAESRARSPIPAVELHNTDDSMPLTNDEASALVQSYVKARSNPDGAVLYTPSQIQMIAHGAGGEADMMIQARNSSAIDVARLMGIPASLIDASNVNSTLTYETSLGRNSEFIQHCLSLYTGAIESRLSMDDVVPRGQRVRFDMTGLSQPGPISTGVPTDD